MSGVKECLLYGKQTKSSKGKRNELKDGWIEVRKRYFHSSY